MQQSGSVVLAEAGFFAVVPGTGAMAICFSWLRAAVLKSWDKAY